MSAGPTDARRWSGWQAIASFGPVSADVLAETLDGGQAFRWNRDGEAWLGVWGDCVARVRLAPSGQIEWSAPEPLAATVARALPEYLAIGDGPVALTDSLP